MAKVMAGTGMESGVWHVQSHCSKVHPTPIPRIRPFSLSMMPEMIFRRESNVSARGVPHPLILAWYSNFKGQPASEMHPLVVDGKMADVSSNPFSGICESSKQHRGNCK
jgi:hypothetical protein